MSRYNFLKKPVKSNVEIWDEDSDEEFDEMKYFGFMDSNELVSTNKRLDVANLKWKMF